MFALATLLSSSILFNSTTEFNEKSLLEIGLIEDIFRKIKITDQNFNVMGTPDGKKHKERISSNENIKQQTQHLLPQMTPKLVWVVHDSKMKYILPKSKETISKDYYFEHKLQDMVQSRERKIQRLRNTFCSLFPDREMVALSHPAGPAGEGEF